MPSTLNLKTPGVYIQEIRKFPPSVAQVETAIPAFIGHTEMAKEKEDGDLRNRPKKIDSLVEYEQFFGGRPKETAIQVRIETSSDGSTPTTVTASIGAGRSPYIMYYALQAFFDNGGGDCYIVSVGDYQTAIDVTNLNAGLDLIAKEDEVTLLCFPEATSLASIADYKALHDAALDQCNDLQDRFTVMDVYGTSGDIDADVDDFRSNGIRSEVDFLKYGAAYYPFIETIFDFDYEESAVTVEHILDGSAGGPLAGTLDALKSANNALHAQALSAINQIPCELPPSPIMCGIYARVDENRGVWKAPANVSVLSSIKPVVKISDKDQEDLNVDTVAGKSVNVIRSFVGKGVLVWGARTLAGNDNEWRYIPVRRFFNMAEESIKKASAQFVFEPNDANTWIKVRGMIENFLVLQWRAGALAGPTPEQAFFVKVGLGETMTAIDILEGRMIVEIGMAVVRPAEFIILRFSHKMQEA